MAANKTIGGINVTITATTDKFVKGITQARKLIGGMVSSVKGLIFNMKTLGGVLAAGMFTKLVADQFDAINSLKDLSDKTGVSTDKLAGLQLAAEEAGIPMTLLEKSLTTLNNKMGMAGDQALRVWIEKTSKLATQQEKLAAATEMFGAKGASMVRFLNGGVEALDEQQKAAEALGLAITQEVAIGVDRATESFGRFKKAVAGIFRSLAGEIAPFIELLSVKATAFITSNGGGKGMGTFIADVIVEMAKNVADSINWMVGKVVGLVGEAMKFIHEWRKTSPAEVLGFGFKNNKDRGASFMSYAGVLGESNKILGKPPSKAIQEFIDQAKKQSAEAAAQWKASQGSVGLLDGIIADAKKFGMGSLESWKGAGKGLFGAASGGFMKMAMDAGAFRPDITRPAVQSLSAQDPLSREGNSQRVRSLSQNGQKIAQQQLQTQKNSERHLKKIADNQVAFAPMGI